MRACTSFRGELETSPLMFICFVLCSTWLTLCLRSFKRHKQFQRVEGAAGRITCRCLERLAAAAAASWSLHVFVLAASGGGRGAASVVITVACSVAVSTFGCTQPRQQSARAGFFFFSSEGLRIRPEQQSRLLLESEAPPSFLMPPPLSLVRARL